MTRRCTRRQALAAALTLGSGTSLLAAPPRLETFTGKVRPLADVLKQAGVKLDPAASPHWLALVTDDGKIIPLVKDDGARVFFEDREVLNRPMRISGQIVPGSQLLVVIQVHSVLKGIVHDLYYWCDVCSIRRRSKMICECCGGPMDRKEEPLKK